MISSIIKLMLLALSIAVVNSTLEFMDFEPYIQARDSASQQLKQAVEHPENDGTQQAGTSDKKESTGTPPNEAITKPISPENW